MRDRGQTTDEIERDGSTRTVLVREWDTVHIMVRPDDADPDDHTREVEITIFRLDPHDPWSYEIDACGATRPFGPATTGTISGPGDVLRLTHKAREALGLPLPSGAAPAFAGSWDTFKARRSL